MEDLPRHARRVDRLRRRRWTAAAAGAALGVPRVGVWLLAILAYLIVSAMLVLLGVLVLVTWAANRGLLPENAPSP